MAMGTGLGRRATDRVEDGAAWLLVVAGLLVVVTSVVIGVDVDLRLMRQAVTEDAQHTRAVAHLLVDASVVGSAYADATPVTVPATWTDERGGEHTGYVSVPPDLRAGSAVAIWTDASGAKASTPPTSGQALLIGVLAGATALGLGMTALMGLWSLVRRATLAANYARWEQEWREIAPVWTGGNGTPD